MTLVDGGAVMQSRLSLRHVCRVLSAMSSSVCLCNLLLVVCYTTDCEAAAAARAELNHACHTSQVSTSYIHTYIQFLVSK